MIKPLRFLTALFMWWPIYQSSSTLINTRITLAFVVLCLLSSAVSLLHGQFGGDDTSVGNDAFRLSELSVVTVAKVQLLLVVLLSVFYLPALLFFAAVYLLIQAFYAQFATRYLRRLLLFCADIGLAIMVGNLLIV